MAFMKTCCCCCDLRTGVLLIGIFSLIGAGYNVVNEVISLRRLEDAKAYFARHPGDSEKYGFSYELLDTVEMMGKVGIGMAAVTVISAICLLIPACHTQRQLARPFRGCLFVYVAWGLIGILFSLGYGGWVLAKFTNPIVAAALIAGFGITIPLTVYFILVVIAFYIELGEDAVIAGGVIVQQTAVPYAGLQNEQPPPYPAYPQPPYAEKGGMV